ncbi:MAG: sigma-70 family RNA polymerase sigma factor [Microthrixaceae bacterium]|nr:sigma-70 family RNA polymerase sigma factor [Microthrixaceae bacterium]
MLRPLRGAPAGFEASFDALYARAFTAAGRLLWSSAASEDAAAETMMRAYLHWGKVGRASWREGWVVRVATNLALDAIRKDRRLDHHSTDETGRVDPDVAERLALTSALRTLTRRQREVVVLRYLEECTQDETAAVLRVSVGSVKTHASRGLAAMREQLGPDVNRWETAADEEATVNV